MIPIDRWKVNKANEDTERAHLNSILESIGATIDGIPGGIVDSVVAGPGIDVDATDPANPVVEVDASLITDITSAVQPGDNVSVLVNDADYISDAPADGALYGRYNNLWVGSTAELTLVDTTGWVELIGPDVQAALNVVDIDLDNIQSQLPTKQPLDATLTALAGANWAANALPIGSGADTVAQISFAANTFPARASTGNLVAKSITDFGLSLVDDADATAGRTTLAAASSVDVALAGIGEPFGVVLTDLNTTITREPFLFSFTNATTNAPFTNPGAGYHIPVSATAAAQMAVAAGNTVRVYVRSASSSAYNTWLELAFKSPRISTAASSNITPNWENVNLIERTAQAAAITINDASTHAQDGELVGFRLKATGANRAITWNAAYRGMTTALPANVINGKTLMVWFRRNSTDGTYDIDNVQLQP